MGRFYDFIKKEIVLVIAILLATWSAFQVRPDSKYIDYIDFRTLAILFCMMTIVAGLRQIGVFDRLAEKLMGMVKGMGGMISILVLSCFFLSMLITNDVSLITFVPFTIVILKRMGVIEERKILIRIVVMQTIAANLGSMLTPIGNPQNLYLFGQSSMKAWQFLALMLPYSMVSLGLLLLWIWLPVWSSKKNMTLYKVPSQEGERQQLKDNKKLYAYLLLFILSLLVVGRMIPVAILFVLVLGYTLIRDQKVLKTVDYSLIGTFAALFIFIGNLGRIQVFSDFLHKIINGKEVYTAVIASQVMSNVPAAILLSKFTGDIKALLIGTNLGGLGTLIASMASLISFKYIAREDGKLIGKFLGVFTAANMLFLAVLLGVYQLIG